MNKDLALGNLSSRDVQRYPICMNTRTAVEPLGFTCEEKAGIPSHVGQLVPYVIPTNYDRIIMRFHVRSSKSTIPASR